MMDNPIEMMTFRNPPDPGDGPAPYRSANQPGDDARQNYCGDLDKVGKNEDFIEQVPLELLEIGHQVLPDRERFDFRLPSAGASPVTGDPGWRIEHMSSMCALDVLRDVLATRALRPRFNGDRLHARERRTGRPAALQQLGNWPLLANPGYLPGCFGTDLDKSGGRGNGENA